jgi:guanine nucleotide-binding protein subunit gamma, fungi
MDRPDSQQPSERRLSRESQEPEQFHLSSYPKKDSKGQSSIAGSSTPPTTQSPSSPSLATSTQPTHNTTTPSAATMPQYTSRDVGDPSQIKKNKQSMADLKLRRLTELNNRLREDLERERIPVSNASKR